MRNAVFEIRHNRACLVYHTWRNSIKDSVNTLGNAWMKRVLSMKRLNGRMKHGSANTENKPELFPN